MVVLGARETDIPGIAGLEFEHLQFRYELQIRRGDADASLLKEGLQDAVHLQLSGSGRDISFDANPGLVHLVDGGEGDGARFRDERLRVECTIHVADSRKLLGEW